MKTSILVLGAAGMLGNAVYSYLRRESDLIVTGTISNRLENKENQIVYRLETERFIRLSEIISSIKPRFVVNCIGFIRPDESVDAVHKSYFVNSYFPKVLETLCAKFCARLIHPSTDCVFSGINGPYSDTDIPDAIDVYGRSKYLGETSQAGNLTIRTSIIGHETNTNRNLLNWYLSQSNEVGGYSRVMWNGITTLTWAKIVNRIVKNDLLTNRNLIQLASETISKYDLLLKVKSEYKSTAFVRRDETKINDRTLVASREQSIFEDLIDDLSTQIKDLRNFYAQS